MLSTLAPRHMLPSLEAKTQINIFGLHPCDNFERGKKIFSNFRRHAVRSYRFFSKKKKHTHIFVAFFRHGIRKLIINCDNSALFRLLFSIILIPQCGGSSILLLYSTFVFNEVISCHANIYFWLKSRDEQQSH